MERKYTKNVPLHASRPAQSPVGNTPLSFARMLRVLRDVFAQMEKWNQVNSAISGSNDNFQQYMIIVSNDK